jgi:hypothetical protein
MVHVVSELQMFGRLAIRLNGERINEHSRVSIGGKGIGINGAASTDHPPGAGYVLSGSARKGGSGA